MNIKIIAVGKITCPSLRKLMDDYNRQCTWKITVHEIIPKKTMSIAQHNKAYQAELIQALIPKNTTIILLDERGKNLSSQDLARDLEQYKNQGLSPLVFIIGGADGLDQSLYDRAHTILSFGKMTWPHKLVRLMLMEQLYRAEKIIAGHPYHRE